MARIGVLPLQMQPLIKCSTQEKKKVQDLCLSEKIYLIQSGEVEIYTATSSVEGLANIENKGLETCRGETVENTFDV